MAKKYIDAEKLIAEIDARLHCNGAFDEVGDSSWHYDQGMVDAYKHLRKVVTTLQQEQLEVDLENEMEKFGECWPYPASFDGYDKEWVDELVEECAKHFHKLGFNARKEE